MGLTKKIQPLWQRFSQCGVEENMPLGLKKRIIISNQLSLVIALVMLLFIPIIVIALGRWSEIVAYPVLSAIFLTFIYLNDKGYHHISRNFISLLPPAAIYMVSIKSQLMEPEAVGIYFGPMIPLIITVSFPLLLIENDKRWVLRGYILYYLAAVVFFEPMRERYGVGMASYGFQPEQLKDVFFSQLFSFVLLLSVLRGYLRTNHAYEELVTQTLGNEIRVNQHLENVVAKLDKTEKQFAALFNHTDMGVTMTDLKGKFTHVNKKFCEMLGYTQDEFLEKSMKDITAREDADASMKHFKALMAGEIPFAKMKKRYLKKEGGVVWGNTTVTTIRDPQGHVMYPMAIIENITEQIHEEEKIQLKNQELEAYNEAMDQFVYTVSHDLKLPSINIRNMIRMLMEERENLSEFQLEVLDTLDESGRKMKQTLEDLLEVSRISYQSRVYEEVDLKQIWEDLKGEFSDVVEKQQVKLITAFNSDRKCRQQPAFAKSIFQNLVGNAIKYRSEQIPEVKLSIYDEENWLVLEIEDNGLGMDLSKGTEKLFGMFQRLHDHVEGSGVGLHLVKKMVEKYSGEIEVTSELNKGSKFKVKFVAW